MKESRLLFFLLGALFVLSSCSNIVKAVNTGSLAEVEDALSHGEDVNKRDDAGNTPLILAAKHGDVAIVQILSKHGADVLAKNNEGYDALLAIANYSMPSMKKPGQEPERIGIALEEHIRTAEFLLNKGANVNARTKTGDTPLILAAGLDKKALVELFLRSGANVNELNDEGRSALMIAAMKGAREVICPLEQKGADPTMKDKAGMTAIQYAEKKSGKELAERVSTKCAGLSTAQTATAAISPKKTAADRDEAQIQKYSAALHDPDVSVRTDAVRRLAETNDSRAVLPLINVMSDEHAYVRRRAAVGLGNLRDLRATEVLIKGLSDEDSFVQHYSLEALEKITGQKFGANTKRWREWWDRAVRQE